MFSNAEKLRLHSEVSELDRRTAETLFFFGEKAYQEGKYRRALDLIERAVLMDPQLREAYRLRKKLVRMCT